MDEHQNPEEAAKSGQDHLKSVASDLKEAAGAKIRIFGKPQDKRQTSFEGRRKTRFKSSEAPRRKRHPRPRVGKQKGRLTFATIPPRRSWLLWALAFCWAFFFEMTHGSTF